jgi:hypothetical protein
VTARSIGAALALAVLAAMVACGASRMPEPVPRTSQDDPPSDPLGPRPDDARAQIAELEARIEAERLELDLDAPDGDAAAAMSSIAAGDAAAVCVRSQRATCVDVCKLSDSICANAGSICGLADQLPGDAWAADKCNRGKATCKTASERCCGC